MSWIRTSWADNRGEVYTIVRLSTPVSIGFLLNKLVSFVSVILVGHLGPAELAAAALGSSLINVIGNSVLAGLAGAMSTLCGQVRPHSHLLTTRKYSAKVSSSCDKSAPLSSVNCTASFDCKLTLHKTVQAYVLAMSRHMVPRAMTWLASCGRGL